MAAAWNGVIDTTRRWSIDAQVMEWLDEAGRSLAVFERVYVH